MFFGLSRIAAITFTCIVECRVEAALKRLVTQQPENHNPSTVEVDENNQTNQGVPQEARNHNYSNYQADLTLDLESQDQNVVEKEPLLSSKLQMQQK